MSNHLLLVLLATIAALTYLGALVIKRIPIAEQHYDTDPADDDDEPYRSHSTDDDPEHEHPVNCSSMAEARAVAEHDLPAGAYVEMHRSDCAKREGDECDCDVEAWTVTEKAVA